MVTKLERKVLMTARTIERFIIIRKLPFNANNFTRQFIAESAIIARTLNCRTGDQNWNDEEFIKNQQRMLPDMVRDGEWLIWILDMQTSETSQLPETSRALVINWDIKQKQFECGTKNPIDALREYKKEYLG